MRNGHGGKLKVTKCLIKFLQLDGAISVGQSLRELPLAIKELATRWTFLFICLEQSCEAMLLAGFGAFLPKVEIQLLCN